MRRRKLRGGGVVAIKHSVGFFVQEGLWSLGETKLGLSEERPVLSWARSTVTGESSSYFPTFH